MTSMKKLIHLLICIAGCVAFSSQELCAQELDPEVIQLREACQSLADNPNDKDSLKSLVDYAKNTNGIDRLRSRCMVAVALSSLFTGDTNLYFRARSSHARAYPEDKHLLRIDLKQCLVYCEECGGSGHTVSVCPACEGNKKVICPLCKGRRVVKKGKCKRCNGAGRIVCRRCDGSGEIKVKCAACKGKPVTFKASRQVNEDFGLTLRGMVKWINKEEVFHRKFLAAKQIKDDQERIAAYQQLIESYSYRPEIKDARALLSVDTQKIKERRKALERTRREAEDQEIKVLLGLRDSETPAAAAAVVNEYLDEHPDSGRVLELRALARELEDKAEKQIRRRRMFYIVGGVLVVLFGLSCINITHNRYNVFNSRARNTKEKD